MGWVEDGCERVLWRIWCKCLFALIVFQKKIILVEDNGIQSGKILKSNAKNWGKTWISWVDERNPVKADWKSTGVNLKKINFLNIYFLEKFFFIYLVQIRF